MNALNYLTSASGALLSLPTHSTPICITMRPIVSLLAAALSLASFATATEFSIGVSLIARTTLQLNIGCTCDADCKDLCSFDAICQNNVCVMKDAVPTSTPCPPPSSTATQAPASRTTQVNVVGCSCDDDCQGRYPYDSVCKMNMCVKKDTTTMTTTMTMPCSTPPSSRLAPTSRTTNQNNVVSTPCMSPSSMIIAPVSRTTYIFPVGCSCDDDCKGRYPYDTICQMNICVKVEAESTTICTTTSSSVIIAPTSRTTQNHQAGCTCDADCGPGYCCENGMCKKMATEHPTWPPTAPPSVTLAPISRTTQQQNVGCTCDEDCGDGYYCDNNICVKKATVMPTTPCPTSPSVTVLPTSRTTQQQNVGCSCDEDCGEGYYCEHNICVKKATVLPTSHTTPCTTTPTATVQPTSRTTQQHNNMGCSCDDDCGDGYYCDNNMCLKKATLEPTYHTTSSECTTTPTFTLLPTQRTTMATSVTPATPTLPSTTAVFTAAASRNGVKWGVAMGAVAVLLV